MSHYYQIDFKKNKSNFLTINTSLLLVLLSLALAVISGYIILRFFPNRVVNPDLIFKLFNNNIYLEYISDLLVYFAIVVYAFKYTKDEVKQLILTVNTASIMYSLHSIIKIFTPMMRPTGIDVPSHGVLRNLGAQPGMFPSGHVGIVAVLYLLIDPREVKLKRFFLIILLLEAITMVISRGHYSIDAIGGFLLAYFVVDQTIKRLNKESSII